MKKILISAMHSGAGKTMITFGLIQALRERGLSVQTYKTGPDYIDPMYHRYISNRPCINLDPYFLEKEGAIQKQFEAYIGDAHIAVIEGAMGYYDGIYTEGRRASASMVADALDAEVILIVGEADAKRLPEFLGLYTEHRIKYILFNHVTKEVYDILRMDLPDGIEEIGFLPMMPDIEIKSRHLGLHMPYEAHAKEQAKRIARHMHTSVKLDAFLEQKPKIAIARDEAFCFFYQDNLTLLKQAGFEVVFFSPLRDKSLPKNCGVIWLCGGYPELHAETLSKNVELMADIRLAYKNEVGIIAECGGFMYLHTTFEDMQGTPFTGCGIIGGKAYRTDKLVRFGYIEVEAKEKNLLLDKGESFRSHSFHYFDSNANGEDCIATKANRLRQWDCIHANSHLFAGFPHIYLRSNENMLKHLIRNVLHERNTS